MLKIHGGVLFLVGRQRSGPVLIRSLSPMLHMKKVYKVLHFTLKIGRQ